MKEKIIISLDVTPERAKKIVEQTRDLVSTYKIGPVLWLQWGNESLKYFSGLGLRLMIDLKFHDIPNTVSEALKALLTLPGATCVDFVTLHTQGGYPMLKAAVEARDAVESRAKLAGVTVLTSLKEKDLYRVGINRSVEAQVKKLAGLAMDAGLDGCVASSHELSVIRKTCGDNFLTLIPGIRMEAGAGRTQDQKRPATPREALEAGADYLIVGRDIYSSDNPRERVEALAGAMLTAKK